MTRPSTGAVTVLVNPVAGGGRGLRIGAAAIERLRSLGLHVQRLQGRDGAHAADLGRAAVAAGTDALVVVGGDGMVHLGAQVLAGTDIPLGVVPAGTGNDVARMLGITPNDPGAAAETVVAGVARGRTRRLDLARIGATRVVTVVATGFDSRVNERANQMRRPRGRLRYPLATLAELRTFRPVPYTLEIDDTRVETEAMLVAVGNGPSYGGGLQIVPGARPDDGWLDVVVIGPMGRVGLARTFPLLPSGRHTSHPAYTHHLARRVSVAAPGLVAYGDGERLGPLPVTVDVEPGALLVCAS